MNTVYYNTKTLPEAESLRDFPSALGLGHKWGHFSPYRIEGYEFRCHHKCLVFFVLSSPLLLISTTMPKQSDAPASSLLKCNPSACPPQPKRCPCLPDRLLSLPLPSYRNVPPSNPHPRLPPRPGKGFVLWLKGRIYLPSLAAFVSYHTQETCWLSGVVPPGES